MDEAKETAVDTVANMIHVKVKVKTGMRKDTIQTISDARFEISVKEKPERNRANGRVIELVALHFGIPAKKVRIVKGHHRPSKLLAVDVE